MNCPNCRTELPSEARFCMNCGQPLQAVAASDTRHLSQMTAAAPAPLLEKARQANRLTGERRMVTALFVDVVASRAMIARLGADAAAEVIYAGLDIACPIVYRYEGTITQLQDDELLVFFGAPIVHEDDPVRAVYAALDILEAVRQYCQETQAKYGFDFEVRISLSTGPVTLGPVGDDLKYEYSALGGTLNLVAHIEAAKLPMNVLITEYTYRFVAPFFDCTDLGQVAGGTGSRPVHIYRIDGARPIPAQTRGLAGLQSPMVGRSKELASLVQLTQLLQAGLGRVALILGEPGIGKTRLISEWHKAASPAGQKPGLTWVQGRCLSYGNEQPYHLIISLLRSLSSTPETASEPETRSALMALLESLFEPQSVEFFDVYPYLGHLMGLRLDGESLTLTRQLEPQAHQLRAQSALRRLLTALARRSPLVVVLEDLHWADPTSAEMMSQLLPLAVSERIMFALVMRAEPDSSGWRLAAAARQSLGGRLTELPLEALSSADSRQLVSNLLEIEALPEAARTLILQKAEGNPFFVEEVIRMLIDQGAINFIEGRWRAGAEIDQVEIPDNLQGLLMTRIDRLPEEVKHTLRVAAVIGRQFPVKVLEYVLARERHE